MMRPQFLAVYLADNKTSSEVKYLLTKRSQEVYLPGIWQIVTGKIEGDENVAFAAGREVFEETGQHVHKGYSVNVTMFYDRQKDRIAYSANFCAFLSQNSEIKLSPREHSECRWCSLEQACDLLGFANQKDTMRHIHEHYFANTPNPVSEIDLLEVQLC
jgi:dATP pyrophosphohydrolase